MKQIQSKGKKGYPEEIKGQIFFIGFSAPSFGLQWCEDQPQLQRLKCPLD